MRTILIFALLLSIIINILQGRIISKKEAVIREYEIVNNACFETLKKTVKDYQRSITMLIHCEQEKRFLEVVKNETN